MFSSTMKAGSSHMTLTVKCEVKSNSIQFNASSKVEWVLLQASVKFNLKILVINFVLARNSIVWGGNLNLGTYTLTNSENFFIIEFVFWGKKLNISQMNKIEKLHNIFNSLDRIKYK